MQSKAENPIELTTILRRWQEIEKASIEHTTAIIAKTHNPLIQLIMEIIRQDSFMHKRVQQVLLDSLEKEAIALTPEELGDIWEMVEKHAEMEKETIELATEAQKKCRLLVQKNLLGYLIEDEQKHDRLLGQLGELKKKIYPYA